MSKCACDIWYIYIYMYLYNYPHISTSSTNLSSRHAPTTSTSDRITTVWCMPRPAGATQRDFKAKHHHCSLRGVWDAFGSVPHRLFASFPGCFPSFHWQEHSPTRSLRNIGRLEIPNWRSSTTSWNSFLSTGRLWPPLSVKKSKKSPSSWAYTINHDQEAYHKSYIIIDNPKKETHFGPKI